MPTIAELPPTAQVSAADELPLSQDGTAKSVTVGILLAGTQPAIIANSGRLLGRTSLGPGGPEPVALGTGLAVSSETLYATGTDHAGFPVETSLDPSDQVVVNHAGNPGLLNLTLLRGLFSAGQNIAIDATGTISAATASSSGQFSLGALSPVATIAAADLIGISQGGTDHTISYANLLDGQTIDMAQPAVAASDTDQFWVGQGSNTMLRQTLAALWVWIAGKQPSYKRPVLELAANTTLDGTVHNGRLLICSQPCTLTAVPANMGSGFCCDVINASSGTVTFGGGVVTSAGTSALPAGQSATLSVASYSGGTLVYAALGGGGTSTAVVPGAVAGAAAGAITASGMTLSWSAPTSGGAASAYVVQYRVSGSTTWSVAASGVTATSCTIQGLAATTPYDLSVAAENSAGTGPATIVTATTATAGSLPGAPGGLTAGSATSSTVALTWSAPASGGAAGTYTVQLRVSGSTGWSTFAAGITPLSATVTGLAAATQYDFQVLAVNGAGTGGASAIASTATLAAASSLASVSWNMIPIGSYTHGSAAIGANAHITPATTPVQFGFSPSASVPPAAWVVATFVNTDLWGAYVPCPTIAGTWYCWVEATDGTGATSCASSFTVV